jgi:hypothetical protein
MEREIKVSRFQSLRVSGLLNFIEFVEMGTTLKPLNLQQKRVLSIMIIINGYSIKLKLLLFPAGSGLSNA